MKPSKIFEVYEDDNILFTKNLVPGIKVYDESLKKEGSAEFRSWNPFRSKLAAYLKKGAKNIFIRKDSVILYLGAATGTTVSHVSDIASSGFVFAVDISPTAMRSLYFLAEKRHNIAPILADASDINSLAKRISSADIVYQDIAQKSQVDIFIKNVNAFLLSGCFAFLAVKARSIDVTKKPSSVFSIVQKQLEQHFTIIDMKDLSPFQKDHMMFVCRK